MPPLKYTTEEMLKIMINYHNGKYTYNNFVFTGVTMNVSAQCPKHGLFDQALSVHLYKNGGCQKCKFDELKRQLSIIHNNKYLYEKLQLNFLNRKNIITCKIHGDFKQSIKSHKLGHGCGKCAINKTKKTGAQFIKEANKRHKNKYDYSKFIYTNCSTGSEIVCKEHGSFFQTPNSHMRHGCKKCSGNEKYTSETFIEKFKTIFPKSNLIFDNINYVNGDTKIKVICTNHITNYEFLILPRLLLRGTGCSKCGGTKKLTKDEFIYKANKTHNYKYDYSLCDYKNSRTKVKIICHYHEKPFIFKQTAGSHIHKGRGCSKCSNIISKPEIKWLDSFNNKNILRQKSVTIENRKFRFDGYDPTTNTVYEFYGDFWHGNPERFSPSKPHPIKKIKGKPVTYGELYKFTMQGEKILKKSGYNVISIWESDFCKNFTH